MNDLDSIVYTRHDDRLRVLRALYLALSQRHLDIRPLMHRLQLTRLHAHLTARGVIETESLISKE